MISLRKVTKSIISKCITCQKQRVKRLDNESLSPNRVCDASVFEIVGIDFAGSLFLRDGGKKWIYIFTYRAVHFELASSLSNQGFLECVRRFMARYRRPCTIYNDNGTNFTVML